MREVTYIRHDFRASDQERTELLGYFLLDVPSMVSSFGIVPGREVINQVLATGGGSGGMSPGASWAPFGISEEEYREIVEFWVSLDLQEKFDDDRFRYHLKSLIQDWDIVRETEHLNYLRRCREKYESTHAKRG